MGRIINFAPESMETMMKGIDVLAKAVGSTLGPRGRNVVIDTPYGVPTVTKDGVTVAEYIQLTQPVEKLGAEIVKQAASRSAKAAGDGTTTATVLADQLIKQGHVLFDEYPQIEIKRGFEHLLEDALKKVEEKSKPVTLENVKQIATISANNDEVIGELIHKGFSFVGTDGVITIEDSKTAETTVETIEGCSFDTGYVSPYFVTDPKRMEAVYTKPLFLITDKKVRSSEELVPAMEYAHKQGRPLIIIADEIEAYALSLLVVNKLRAGVQVAAVKAPGFGDRRMEMLKDLALLTGAELITDAKALTLQAVKPQHLGSAEKIVIEKDSTLILQPSGNQEEVDARIEELQAQLAEPNLNSYLMEKLYERVAMLSGKIAVLNVGASTETELKEKKYRIDDALRATKCAIEKGYVEGGGMTLLRIAATYDIHDPIQMAFAKALSYPHNLIMRNANLEPIAIGTIKDDPNTLGVDALTGTTCDLIDQGVIDPTLVVTEALRNAVSAANMILLSEVAIYDENKDRYDPRKGTEFEYEDFNY